jgi:hypothetical protein
MLIIAVKCTFHLGQTIYKIWTLNYQHTEKFWILQQWIKQVSNWTPRPLSPVRNANLCKTNLKHINLQKMHSPFHPKQFPFYSTRLYYVASVVEHLLGTEGSNLSWAYLQRLPGRQSEASRKRNIRCTECPFMDQNKPRAVLKVPLLKVWFFFK